MRTPKWGQLLSWPAWPFCCADCLISCPRPTALGVPTSLLLGHQCGGRRGVQAACLMAVQSAQARPGLARGGSGLQKWMHSPPGWLLKGRLTPHSPAPPAPFLEGHLGVGGRLRRLHGAGPPFLRASGCPPTRHRPSCGKQTRYFHAFIGYICFSLITYLCILLIIHFIVFSIIHVTYNFCYIIILFITISYIIILNNYGYII